MNSMRKIHTPRVTFVRWPDGKLVGYNTDYSGAISAIEDGIRGFHMPSLTILYFADLYMVRVTAF